MKKWLKKIEDILVTIAGHHVGAYAAQSAFFLMLSLVPILMLLMTLVRITPITQADIIEVAYEVFGDMDRIKLIEPLEVIDFPNFINKSYIILTDSGGIQEEAPSLGKPVLVLRDTTERPEGIEAGTLKLVGTDEDVIYTETKKLLDDLKEYEKMSKASNPYGDGTASKQIVDAIIEKYSSN